MGVLIIPSNVEQVLIQIFEVPNRNSDFRQRVYCMGGISTRGQMMRSGLNEEGSCFSPCKILNLIGHDLIYSSLVQLYLYYFDSSSSPSPILRVESLKFLQGGSIQCMLADSAETPLLLHRVLIIPGRRVVSIGNHNSISIVVTVRTLVSLPGRHNCRKNCAAGSL